MSPSVQRKIIVLLLVLGLAMIVTVPVVAQSHATGTVSTGALNVRSGPDYTYSKVTTLYNGQQVTVLGRYHANHWVLIRTQSGIEGWVNSSYMRLSVPFNHLPVIGGNQGGNPPPPPPPSPSPPSHHPSATVATGALNVRSGPSVNYPVVTKIFNGETVYMLARQANSTWILIRTHNGAEGWVNSQYMRTSVPISSLPVAGGGPGSPPPSQTPTATVQTGALNIRRGPSPAYPVVTTVYNGQTLIVYGRNHDSTWLYVKAPNGQEGWANLSFLGFNYPVHNLPVKPTAGEAGVASVAVGALNVRLGPGPQFGIITTLTYGNEVIMIGRNSSATWVQIRTQSGTVGWVNATYLSTEVPVTVLPITY